MIVRSVVPAAEGALAAALLDLQREAYAVEAQLIGDDRIPALHEDVEALAGAPLDWLVALEGADVLGAVGLAAGDEVDIDRLVVAVTAHRRGVGTRLVRAVLAVAGTRTTTVSTGRDNAPARALYEGLGFAVVGDREVLPGLWVTDHAHTPAPWTRTVSDAGDSERERSGRG